MSTPISDQPQSDDRSENSNPGISMVEACRERQDCLETAEALLLNCSEGDNPRRRRRRSSSVSADATSLTQLHDRLCVLLASSSSPSSLSSPGLLSQILLLRRRSLADNDDDDPGPGDTFGPRHATAVGLAARLQTEADLYRVLWITSLSLLDMASGPTDGAVPPAPRAHVRDHLTRTAQRCKALVGMLEGLLGKLLAPDGGDASLHPSPPPVWQTELRRWMSNRPNHAADFMEGGGDSDPEGEDESNLMVAISREQLEVEERELRNMASAPIPPERRGPYQTVAAPTQAGSSHSHRQLEARLLVPDSSSTIPVRLDDRREATLWHVRDGGNPRSQATAGDEDGWAITSQSVLSPFLSDGHPGRLLLSNLVCIRTGKVLADAVLEVEGNGTAQLWWEKISAAVVQVLSEASDEQEEMLSAWSMDEVLAVQKLVQQNLPSLLL